MTDASIYREAHSEDNAKRINEYLREWGAVGFRAGFMLARIGLDSRSRYQHMTLRPSILILLSRSRMPRGQSSHFGCPPEEQQSRRPGYIELPYSLPQDSTLFLLFRESSPDIWIRKLDWVADHKGMAMVIVHPDYLRFPGDPPNPRTYPVEHYYHFWTTSFPLFRRLLARLAQGCCKSHGSCPTVFIEIRECKRVCILTYSFYEQDSRVYRYAHALAERGDEVTVFALRSSPDQPTEEVVDGLSGCSSSTQKTGRKVTRRVSWTSSAIPLAVLSQDL